ncbi:MAG: ATP-binding protein [Chloroflexota bacterium]
MNSLTRLFTAPTFEDEIKTQQAYLLHVILWTLICVPIPFVIYSFFRTPENIVRTLIQAGFGEAVNIVLLIMLRNGFVRGAAITQVSTFWLFFTATAITGSGVRGEAYLLGYGLVIAIAGILLGGVGILIFTALSLAAGGFMVFRELQGAFNSPFESSPLTTWVVSLVLFPIGAVLQYLASRTVRDSLARARASEERYRIISKITSDYTFSTDITPEGKMKLNWVAGALESMTGYTYNEYIAAGDWLAHLHPDDVEQDAQDMQMLQANKPVITEVRTYKKNGELCWVQVSAQPVWDDKLNQLSGIVGAVKDITQQKQSEQALRYERDLLQIFMDNMPDLVYFKDTESRFIRINNAHTQFLKLNQPQDAIGKTDFDFQPHELAQQFVEEDRHIIATGQPVTNRIEFNPTADGQARWLSASKVPVKDSDGHIIGTIGITRDITAQKNAEASEQRRRETLEKTLHLGQRVTEAADLRTTLKRVWHGVHDDLGFDRLGIFLYNHERKSMDATLGTNNQGQIVEEWDQWFPLADVTIFMQVLERPDGLYFTRHYDMDYEIEEGSDMYGVKEFAAVTARSGDRPIAIICVDNLPTQRKFTDEQLEALRLFAGYAGLAIENARLNDTLQKELGEQKQAEEREAHRRAVLEKVVILGQRVTEVQDLRTTLMRIWHGVHDDLNFDRLGIFLYNPDTNSAQGTFGTNNQGEIVEEWDTQIPLDKNNRDAFDFIRVLEESDGLYFTHNYDIEHDSPEGSLMYGVKDYAAVAAWAGDKPMAVITVDRLITQQPIAAEQLEALRLFAGYAGLAIENARLNSVLQNELTQRQTLIEELETKNAELERFTYTVSHDLKSPLVTITGFLGFLEKDALAGNTEKMKGNINRISNAAYKMQALLNDLLELSRIGRLMNSPEPVPFTEIVDEAVERVRGKLDEMNAIVEIQRNLPVVHCDRTRLVEVIQNLIENAAKYSKPESNPRIEIGAQKDEDDQFVFYVRDNGIGIGPQYHENIFGLFNKLNATSEGTGIGLTLVKRIIEVHGGRIWVKSEADQGATFYFTLPMRPEE